MNLRVEDFIRVAKDKDYALFDKDEIPFNLNYWGVRNPETKIDDEFHLFSEQLIRQLNI